MGADMVCVLESEEKVREIVPNLDVICELDGVCLHVTAKGKEYDCVTRHICSQVQCGGGSCLRARTLPRGAFVGEKIRKKGLNRISGIEQGRRFILQL